jgi:hypothetical protein
MHETLRRDSRFMHAKRWATPTLAVMLGGACVLVYVNITARITERDEQSASLFFADEQQQQLQREQLQPPAPLWPLCSSSALEGAVGSSHFNEVVGDSVRAAAANPASTTSNATLSSFVDSLATQALCFWARYSALPLPDGMHMSLCTHDPAVDAVMSGRIHASGVWFQNTVWSDFRRMLVDGSCPADRPVVLDLGLNIGYVRTTQLLYVYVAMWCRACGMER